ncbi:MAG: DUF4282 domain-containing protein [Planctomycetaceae bacterium]|jgi:hypothetical protein|nr:DUF4282 domain-containing protein [Planctomycetaceae bacterium]
MVPPPVAVPPAGSTNSSFVRADNSFVTPPPLTSETGLLDIGFTRFITPVWISVIWIICIVSNVISFLASLGWIGIIAYGMSQGSRNAWTGEMSGGNPAVGVFVFLLGIVVSIILHLLSLLLDRIFLEVTIVLFRIEENTRAMWSKSAGRT